MPFKIYIYIASLLCTLFCNFLHAQNLYFEKVTTEEGDANLSVRDIIQDESGIIWLATFSGLYKYQGDEFIIKHEFFNNKELDNDVTALAEDKNRNIWIGTNNGVAKFNPVTEDLIIYTTDTIPGSIGSNRIRSLEVDYKGRLWIGTSTDGLFLFQPEKEVFTRVQFDELNVPEPKYVKTIFTDSDGKIWLGTLNDGLYCFSYSAGKVDWVTNYRTDNFGNLSHDNVYGIFKDNDGTIAVCTRDGLNIKIAGSESFEDISSKHFQVDHSTNFFRNIIRGKDDKLWILTWEGLILTDSFSNLQSGNFTLLKNTRNNPSSISHNQAISILEDKSGIIWIGTESGFNKYSPYQNQFQSVDGEVVKTMLEQSVMDYAPYKGGLLILTPSEGILYSHNGKVEKFCDNLLSTKKLRDDKMYSLLVASDTSVWVGTLKGRLLKIEKNCQSITVFRNSSENSSIYELAEWDEQTLLIGTEIQGLKYFNRKQNVFTVDKILAEGFSIKDLYIDKNKKLWVATQRGIFFRNFGSIEFNYFLPDDPAKIPNANIFYSIVESVDSQIVAGGRHGLYVYNSEENEFVKKEFNNISRVWITDMQFDSAKQLWLNLNFNQIAKWDMHSNELEIFDVKNGVRHFKYNHRGFYIDKEDILHISGFDKFYRFNTSNPVKNTYSPSPVFTDLIINNTVVQPGKELDGHVVLKKNINYQDKLTLNHKHKGFTISFTSASYINYSRNKYKYKLHGYNQDWIIGNDKSVTFQNLKPGNYTFEVFSANSDGFWSQDSSSLEIKIKPSPFLSIWAILVYLLVIIAITYQIGKMVKARILLRRELLIERVKREKEEKFHEERLRFYTNISHEIRTPLTLIMGPIKQIIANEVNGDKNTKLNKLILNNSQRMLTLVNQLLDFRKSLHQGMKLKTSYSDVVGTVESNIQSFDYMAQEKSISVKFNTESNFIKGWFDQEKLDIILFNILSNAFKYTPNGGFITIDLKTAAPCTMLNNECIELSVLNTGKGIPKHFQEKVFERFFQVNDNSGSFNTGSGIGLALVKNLVKMHHGKITVESELEKSTCFSILIPIEKEAYSEDEIFDFAVDADRRTMELCNKTDIQNTGTKEKNLAKELPKILIVEDNVELRDYIVEFLKDEFKVFEANNGLAGLEICASEMPDLVVSDVMMDGVNGWTLCKRLKADSEISHIPVILMTALASQENKRTGYKVGADDYITKPFEPELLKIRIHNILENRSKIKESYLTNKITSIKELTISRPDEEFMEKIIEILEKNMDNPDFDIDSFCKEVSVSSSKLYRKIKGISGLSPVEFITNYRLKRASDLLQKTDLSISEIAYKVGFNDPRYFSKRFKKQFGMTPSAFLLAP